MVKHMMKPLVLASLLVVSSFALIGCGSDDDDPVIREQQGAGTPKQPFSASLSDEVVSDTPVDPAEGRDIPTGPEVPNQQAQPQFRE